MPIVYLWGEGGSVRCPEVSIFNGVARGDEEGFMCLSIVLCM